MTERYLIQVYRLDTLTSSTQITADPSVAEAETFNVFTQIIQSKQPLKLVVSKIDVDEQVIVTNDAYNKIRGD